ncbi:MAG TPA: hypothetical protein VEC18_11165 [Myxococcota bacterium]|nr:hypothetical protein [Myxococcota bacterium]
MAFGALTLGCAQIRHEYHLAPGKAFSASATRALLLPINETEAIPDGLEVGQENVFAELQRYLESQGLRVQTVDSYAYRAAANRATESAHERMLAAQTSSAAGELRFEHIVPALFSSLQSDAELLILANLVIRTGESSGGRSTRWDGVKRRIPVPSRWRFEGTESVASVYVSVYERDGSAVFSGYGGLDLLFAPNLREERYQLIPDRLQDLDNIREGVCVAFYPYFGEDERCG